MRLLQLGLKGLGHLRSRPSTANAFCAVRTAAGIRHYYDPALRIDSRTSSRPNRQSIPAVAAEDNDNDNDESSSGTKPNETCKTSSSNAPVIHFLGDSNLCLLAIHELARRPQTLRLHLIFYTPSAEADFSRADRTVVVSRHKIDESSHGFESSCLPEASEGEPIKSLVVAGRCNNTSQAISRLTGRLGPESTILFMQAGLGVVEEVDARVFPDPKQRPFYMVGASTHEVTRMPSFKISHIDIGSMALSVLPRRSGTEQSPFRLSAPETGRMPESSTTILNSFVRAPYLCALGVSPPEMLVLKIERLAVDAVVLPLAAIFKCRNGELLRNPPVDGLMRLILTEIIAVIHSLPELQGLATLRTRFSMKNLFARTKVALKQTADQVSYMLQDTRKGIAPDIEFVNGYFIRRGEELGIRCIVNYTIMWTVKGNQNISHSRMSDLRTQAIWGEGPLDGPGPGPGTASELRESPNARKLRRRT